MTMVNLTSTVVNTSGVRRYFDFLPPVGAYLDAGASFTHAGTVTEWLRRKGAGPAREKALKGLRYCLEQGYISIKAMPSPVLYDAASERSVQLLVDEGDVVTRTVFDVVIPTVTDASVDATGLVLTVTFSENVVGTAGISLATTGEAVLTTFEDGEGTAEYTYTLSRAVEDTETLTLVYVGSDITDHYGNALVPFAGLAVENNSTVSE